jgi:hypothetical protein
LERVAEAMEDADEILECYRRIQRLLERVAVSIIQPDICLILMTIKLNANVNTWKIIDEQATVCDTQINSAV